MPIPTFTPPHGPKPGFDRSRNLKVKNNPFGDNYSQMVPQGINNALLQEIELTWELLTWAQAKALEDFLLALTGTQPFYYTLPPDTVAKKFVSQVFTARPEKGDLASFSAKFKEIP